VATQSTSEQRVSAPEPELRRAARSGLDVMLSDARSRRAEAHNANYVSRDVVTASNDARQLVFRPRPALDPYLLGIPGVYLCSAAKPPGAGAHGMCDCNAAISVLRRLGSARGAAARGTQRSLVPAP
jgi:phytoene dehydrogenase-like protein